MTIEQAIAQYGRVAWDAAARQVVIDLKMWLAAVVVLLVLAAVSWGVYLFFKNDEVSIIPDVAWFVGLLASISGGLLAIGLAYSFYIYRVNPVYAILSKLTG